MCYTEGQRKQEEMRVAFWPWTQPPRLTYVMLLGALIASSEEEDRFFWMAGQIWEPAYFFYRGALMTLLLDLLLCLKTDLWQHCRRREILAFVCILGICINVSSISLPF